MDRDSLIDRIFNEISFENRLTRKSEISPIKLAAFLADKELAREKESKTDMRATDTLTQAIGSLNR